MRLKRNLTIGVIIIVFGLLPFLYTQYRYRSHNWTPLTLPVNLQRGVIHSPSFETDLDGTYVVWLGFDHMPNFDREDCLLGSEFPPETCANVPQILHVNISVYEGDRALIKDQPYQPGSTDSTDDEYRVALGTFEGRRHSRAHIVMTILQTADELNTANPCIIVEAHESYWQQWIILSGIAFIVAGLFALIGAVWIIGSVFLHRRSKTPLSAKQPG